METERFVLECLRAESEKDFASLKRVYIKRQSKIDWLSIAQHSAKILPFLCLRIIRCCKDLPAPSRIISQMKLNYLFESERNKKIKLAVKELAQKCKEADVEIIFLKGAALLATVYQDDEGLRPMDDVDVLLRKGSLPKFESIIFGLGYREDYQLLSRQFNADLSRNYFLQSHFHLIYFKDDLRLEAHWDVGWQHTAEAFELLWSARTVKELGKTPVTILNGEGSIFTACLNFSRDFPEIFKPGWFQIDSLKRRAFFYSLFFFNELKQLVEYHKDDMRWDSFYQLLKINQKEYEALTLLLLARKILNVNIPSDIFKHARYKIRFRLFCAFFQLRSADHLCELLILRDKMYYYNNALTKTVSVFFHKLLRL